MYLYSDFRTFQINEQGIDNSVSMTDYMLDGPYFELQWVKYIPVIHPHVD